MRLYTIEINGTEQVAMQSTDGRLYPIAQFGLEYRDMNELIGSATPECWHLLAERTANPEGRSYGVEEVKLCSPIPHPRQDVICLGINYAAHAEEAARFRADAFGGERPYPIFFSKRAYTTTGDGDPIPSYPGLVDSLDYEVELGVIIGRDAKNLSREEAFSCVLGYTIINDVSARNLQTRHKQWYFGKGLDGFTPMGPCIVTREEFTQPPALQIRCYVNDQLRQDSTTDLLLTGIDEIISQLSQGMELKAGTIIATGTPAGVGMGMTPPCFLRTGDVVRCEIEGIGRLTNVVV